MSLLTESIRKIGGNYTELVEVRGNDEISELARYNEMAQAVEDKIFALEKDNRGTKAFH